MMIRKLFFTAALLMPGLAYSANPSTNLTVQIAPAGSDPAVPTEAANAGFTTLAANFDFSQPLYATQSNWLDCVGTNNSLPWHKGSPGVTNTVPCNVHQVVDPVTGQTVMDLQRLLSYNGPPIGVTNGEAIQTCSDGGDKWGGTCTAFPYMYLETVYRIDAASTHQNGGVYTWQTSPGGSSDQPLEFDLGELYNTTFGSNGYHNYINNNAAFFWDSNPGDNNLPPGWSPTTYQKYGMLITSDGRTSVMACSFVGDRLQKCYNVGAQSPQYANLNWLVAAIGDDATNAINATINLYIQYIRVWTCANRTTTTCNGSTLFNSGGLTYWH
jgi:hypothetical protein